MESHEEEMGSVPCGEDGSGEDYGEEGSGEESGEEEGGEGSWSGSGDGLID